MHPTMSWCVPVLDVLGMLRGMVHALGWFVRLLGRLAPWSLMRVGGGFGYPPLLGARSLPALGELYP